MKTLSLSKAFVFIALITCLGVMLSGCPKNIKLSNPEVAIFHHTEDSLHDKRDELIAWKKPSYNQTDFNHWIDTFTKSHYPSHVQYYCTNCDSSLVLLKGDGIKLLLENVPPGGTGKTDPKGKLTGGDGPAYLSVNFKVSLPEMSTEGIPFEKIILPKKILHYNKEDEVVVAVFDSGVREEVLDGFQYRSSSPACLITAPGAGNADRGWNFADHNNKLTDENRVHHGTVVTRFIIDQVEKIHNSPIRILPVKLFSKDGTATLFDVLCAFVYAKERGAKVINASFGFYTLNDQIERASGFDDENLLLFKTFLKKNIDSANIILVAAAGNKDVSSSVYTDFYNYYKTSNGFTNLDSIGFYPASISGFANNVIAVTTIESSNSYVSDEQNHSDSLVGIGVKADVGKAFKNSIVDYFPGQPITVKGSSFATPIITGKIAANYYELQSFLKAPHTRDQLLEELSSIGLIKLSNSNRALYKQIIKGYHTKK